MIEGRGEIRHVMPKNHLIKNGYPHRCTNTRLPICSHRNFFQKLNQFAEVYLDIEHLQHAIVLACQVNSIFRAERGLWRTPY